MSASPRSTTRGSRIAGWLLSFAALFALHLQVFAHLAPPGAFGNALEQTCSAASPAAGQAGSPAAGHAHGVDCALCCLTHFSPPLPATGFAFDLERGAEFAATRAIVLTASSAWTLPNSRAPPLSMTA